MNLRGRNIDIKEYWQRVREIQRDLLKAHPMDALCIVRLADKYEGTPQSSEPVDVDTENAAKLIFAGTHREATEEEIEERAQKRQITIAALASAQLTANGIVSVTVPKTAKAR